MQILTYSTPGGGWAFDDDRVGLDREPFVAGADTLITELSGGKKQVSLTFSGIKFPSAKIRLDMVDGDPTNGTNYVVGMSVGRPDLEGRKLWLCPALNLYFTALAADGKSPAAVYVDYAPVG